MRSGSGVISTRGTNLNGIKGVWLDLAKANNWIDAHEYYLSRTSKDFSQKAKYENDSRTSMARTGLGP